MAVNSYDGLANDTRRRYTHQAYDVTMLGGNLETSPSGYGQRLEATYDANIFMQAEADVTTPQIMGDITQGIFIRGMINHLAIPAGTLVFTLPEYTLADGTVLDEVIINTQALDLTTESIVFTGMAPFMLLPQTYDRPLAATITGGTPGFPAQVSLMVTPLAASWK